MRAMSSDSHTCTIIPLSRWSGSNQWLRSIASLPTVARRCCREVTPFFSLCPHAVAAVTSFPSSHLVACSDCGRMARQGQSRWLQYVIGKSPTTQIPFGPVPNVHLR